MGITLPFLLMLILIFTWYYLGAYCFLALSGFFSLKILPCLSHTAHIDTRGSFGCTRKIRLDFTATWAMGGIFQNTKVLKHLPSSCLTVSSGRLTPFFLKHLLDSTNVMIFYTEHMRAFRGSYQPLRDPASRANIPQLNSKPQWNLSSI